MLKVFFIAHPLVSGAGVARSCLWCEVFMQDTRMSPSTQFSISSRRLQSSILTRVTRVTCHVTIEQICHEISITGASRGFWHDHTSRPSGNAVINMRKYWKFKLFNGNHFALFRFDDIISTIVPLIVYHQKVCGTHRDLFKHFTLIDLYMRPTLNLQLKVISFNWTLKLLRDQRGPVLFYFQIFNKAFHSPTISSEHLNETFVGHEPFFEYWIFFEFLFVVNSAFLSVTGWEVRRQWLLCFFWLMTHLPSLSGQRRR